MVSIPGVPVKVSQTHCKITNLHRKMKKNLPSNKPMEIHGTLFW